MDEPMKIMQGDAYYIAVTLTDDDDEPITDGNVYVTLGTLIKKVTYSEEEEAWLFPLSQEESFALDFLCGLEARLVNGATAVGAVIGNVYVISTENKEVVIE